jgi:hypothetical protein
MASTCQPHLLQPSGQTRTRNWSIRDHAAMDRSHQSRNKLRLQRILQPAIGLSGLLMHHIHLWRLPNYQLAKNL